MLFPLFFEFINGETTEHFFLATEIVVEGGHEQTLAKAARTAQEIDLASSHHVVYQCCLVHIYKSSIANLLKALHSYRVLHFHDHLCFLVSVEA